MRPATVSVIIPTYNYGCYLPDAVESVLSQTYPIHEIIVVDDGSTDDTREVVGQFADKIIYVNQENQGLSGARNTGIRRATGELIAFLDSDDLWYPTKIAEQVEVIEDDSEIGMVHCAIREFDSDSGETITIWSQGKNNWAAEDLLLFEESAVIAIGSTSLVRREVFGLVGDFDPDLKHSEDWDFAYRVAREYKLGFVPEVLAGYRNHRTNMHKNVAAMERAMNQCFAKAFTTKDESVLRLRRRAYGNLYSVLAGSYFYSGNYADFARCSLRCLWLRPRLLGRFMNFPVRWFKRKTLAGS